MMSEVFVAEDDYVEILDCLTDVVVAEVPAYEADEYVRQWNYGLAFPVVRRAPEPTL